MNILALTWILLPWELQSLSVLETSDLQIHLSTPSLPAHVTWKMLLQLCTSHSFYIYQMQIALRRVVSKSYKAASVYIPTNSVWKTLSPVQLFVTPWNSLGQNTGMGSLSLLHGIFPTQGSNPGLHIAGGFFTSWATREAPTVYKGSLFSTSSPIFIVCRFFDGGHSVLCDVIPYLIWS